MLEPDHLLVAEHGHDFRDDLVGGGWHGTMNYAGFLRPAWEWLRGDELPDELRRSFWGTPVGLPRLDGQRRDGDDAGLPRRRSLAVDPPLLEPARQPRHGPLPARSPARGRCTRSGIGLQMTLPGVPMVFAGDEIGLEGAWGEDARRTMPWDRPESLGRRPLRDLCGA